VPFDLQAIISKLDVRLWTPNPSTPPSTNTNLWVSQTPYNTIDVLSQSTLVKSCIIHYQGSSPTPIFKTVATLAKGIEILAHKMTLLSAEICTL
jgi:hypothetical protein